MFRTTSGTGARRSFKLTSESKKVILDRLEPSRGAAPLAQRIHAAGSAAQGPPPHRQRGRRVTHQEQHWPGIELEDSEEDVLDTRRATICIIP